MRCFNCGKNIEDGSLFCEHCGARLDGGMPQQGYNSFGQGVPQQYPGQSGMFPGQNGVIPGQNGYDQAGGQMYGSGPAYPPYYGKKSSPWFAIVSVLTAVVIITLIILFLVPGILTKKHRQTLIEEAAADRLSTSVAKNDGSGNNTAEPPEITGLILDTTEDTGAETTEKKKKTTEEETTEKKKTTEEKTTEKKKTTEEKTTEKKKTTEEKTTEKKKTTEEKTTEKKTTEKTTEQKKDPTQEAYEEAARYSATGTPDYADFDWYTLDYWDSELPYDRIDNKDKLVGSWKCMMIWDPDRTVTGGQAWEFMNVDLSFDDAAGQAKFVLRFCFIDYENSDHVDESSFDAYTIYGNIMPHGLFVNEPFYLEVTGFYCDGEKQYMTGHAVGQSGEQGKVAFVRP